MKLSHQSILVWLFFKCSIFLKIVAIISSKFLPNLSQRKRNMNEFLQKSCLQIKFRMSLFLTMNGLKNFKSGTKNLKFAKSKCNISNQHPRIYQNTKFHEFFFFFALKTQYLGIIGLQFRKTVVIFEISTLGPKMSYLGIFRLKF